MSTPTLSIDGQEVTVQPGQTLLDAARSIGIDIPTLCHLKECGPLTTCLVCLVKVNGRLTPSCATQTAPGMVVESETTEVREARRTALELLFSDHVGDCLSPCQRLCPLQFNAPALIRQVGEGRLDEAAATLRQGLPLAGVLGRLCNHPCEQGCRRGAADEAADICGLERFVADHDRHQTIPHAPALRPSTGKTVAILGAGPTGLTAAFYLARNGHAVTVLDRHDRAGGSLLALPETELPGEILAAEIALLARMGIQFRLGETGDPERLTSSFDALLLAVGELSPEAAQRLTVDCTASGIKTDPVTSLTSLPHVFAAGSAVKPVKLLVRAMTEGKSAAECIHRFLVGDPIRRAVKPFSSIMGRLEASEIALFLQGASAEKRVSPCDACAGFTGPEAASEAARCLHCDCRSAGNCALQHYAQVYDADASRFRGQRQPFEQQIQPGGVIFEPGKCILCGICVKLTEAAREPLGLTFIGRGFNVRIGAPFSENIERGLQQTAAECVRHCPTGALAMR